MPFTVAGTSSVGIYSDDLNDRIRRRRQRMAMEKTEKKHVPKATQLITTIKLSLPHCIIVLLVVAYALVGALLFQAIEKDDDLKNRNATLHNLRHDVNSFLATLRANLKDDRQYTDFKMNLRKLLNAKELAYMEYKITNGVVFEKNTVIDSQWDFANSVLFAFTVITTIGYGNLAPKTFYGRLLCMFYGLIGIPITMLAIANIGKFLSEFMVYVYFGIKDKFMQKATSDDDQPSLKHGPVIALFVAFTIYVVLGATVLPLWEDLDFFSSCYFSFITITTCGFGDIVPHKTLFFFPTIVYFTFGLAIATLTIDVAAAYFRHLHYLGAKIKGAKHAFIWFGSKVLTVSDLVYAVGKEHGIPEKQLDNFLEKDNFDQVVIEAVEEKERQEAEQRWWNRKLGASTDEDMKKLLAPLFDDVEWRYIDDSRPVSKSSSVQSSMVIYDYEKITNI